MSIKSHILTKAAEKELAQEIGGQLPSIAIATLEDGTPKFFAPSDKKQQDMGDIPESERINQQVITTFSYTPKPVATGATTPAASVKPLTCIILNGVTYCW
ncbi:MAG: hypothetical protein PHU14_02955 [Methylovulum sp.]|nr:hypothetical protein [Methylovulum sp.]